MKNFKIKGVWVAPDEGRGVIDWLSDVVAYDGVDDNMQPTGVIRRYQTVERIRQNGRGKGKDWREEMTFKIKKLHRKGSA